MKSPWEVWLRNVDNVRMQIILRKYAISVEHKHPHDHAGYHGAMTPSIATHQFPNNAQYTNCDWAAPWPTVGDSFRPHGDVRRKCLAMLEAFLKYRDALIYTWSETDEGSHYKLARSARECHPALLPDGSTHKHAAPKGIKTRGSEPREIAARQPARATCTAGHRCRVHDRSTAAGTAAEHCFEPRCSPGHAATGRIPALQAW